MFSECYSAPRDRRDNHNQLNVWQKRSLLCIGLSTLWGQSPVYGAAQHGDGACRQLAVSTDPQRFLALAVQAPPVCVMGSELKIAVVFLIIVCVT